jgi:hypothetical protein
LFGPWTNVNLNHLNNTCVGRVAQSEQRLATGWTVRWSNSGGGEIFRTCLDRQKTVTSHNAYWLVFLGAFAKLRKAINSFIMLYVRPSILTVQLAFQWEDFMKFGIRIFFENLSRYFKFRYYLTGITVLLHEVFCTFVITSHWMLLRIRNVSDFRQKLYRKSKHFMFNKFFYPRKSCRKWVHVEKHSTARQATYETIIQRMQIVCRKPKATQAKPE